jgi:hypothetical protein
MGYEDDTPENAIKNQFKRIEQILNSRETFLIDQIKGLAAHIDDQGKGLKQLDDAVVSVIEYTKKINTDLNTLYLAFELLERYLMIKFPNYLNEVEKIKKQIIKEKTAKPRGRKKKKDVK